MNREIPICKKHKERMAYSQYSYYWHCPKCDQEVNGDDNKSN